MNNFIFLFVYFRMGKACVTHGSNEKYRHNTRTFKLCLVQVNLVLCLRDSRWYLCHLLLDFADGLYSSGFYPKNGLHFLFFFPVCAIFLPI